MSKTKAKGENSPSSSKKDKNEQRHVKPEPGDTHFEKMISGMYLGEIVRLVLVKLTQDKLLFKGRTSEELKTKGKFETKFISEIEEKDKGPENTKEILTQLGLEWDQSDVDITRLVCEKISTRAAHLCAAAVTTIAKRIHANRKSENITVGVDGTVYTKHPNFRVKLQNMVQKLAPELKITFQASEDGSVKGAALVAAVVQRLNKKKEVKSE